MPIRTLIVDDEPIARQVLREELEMIEGVEVMGEADNGVKALDQIARHKPDLVLLDLQMPAMGGFEVVSGIRRGSHMPVIVIVTAYDSYAVQAFEAGAIDYLLKPVAQKRLRQAVERARRVSERQAVDRLAQLQEIAAPAPGPRPRKIVGKAGEEYFLLDAGEIFAFQAEGEFVWVITAQRRYRATESLKIIEQRLDRSNFERIHRNALINLDHVRKMSALSSQRWLITLSNNQAFIASKRRARSVRQFLSG
jgi:DNA-binding LytR/AlgR family response regulator